MSDEPSTNAAVEFMRASVALLNTFDSRPLLSGDDTSTDDFTFEDRSSGGVNLGPLGSLEAHPRDPLPMLTNDFVFDDRRRVIGTGRSDQRHRKPPRWTPIEK